MTFRHPCFLEEPNEDLRKHFFKPPYVLMHTELIPVLRF